MPEIVEHPFGFSFYEVLLDFVEGNSKRIFPIPYLKKQSLPRPPQNSLKKIQSRLDLGAHFGYYTQLLRRGG